MERNDICVLGASGFIGQNLLKAIPNSRGISLRDDEWEKEALSTDVFINLVGLAHDHAGTKTEDDYFYVNFELVKKIFRVFLQSRAKLFLHISSLSALEELESKEYLVETDICRPFSWYGKSKREAEKWLLEQTMSSDKKLVILRPPMVHGPGDKGNLRLLYNLISKGVPYPLASFNNRRSFICIDNFCFYVTKFVAGHDRIESGIYHIADEDPLSTTEIVDIIKSLTGKKQPNLAIPPIIVRAVAKMGDFLSLPLNSLRLKKLTRDLLVSSAKARSALGGELPLTSENGVRKTIISFQTNA